VENIVSDLINLAKMAAVLLAATMLGKWFLAELKAAHKENKPWYQPYLSIPGLLIMLALLLPVIIWWTRN